MRRVMIFVLAGISMLALVVSVRVYAQAGAIANTDTRTTTTATTATSGSTATAPSSGTTASSDTVQSTTTTTQKATGTASTTTTTTTSANTTTAGSDTTTQVHQATTPTSSTDQSTSYTTQTQPASGPAHTTADSTNATSPSTSSVAPNTAGTRVLDTTVSPLTGDTPVVTPETSTTRLPQQQKSQLSQLENVGTSLRALQKAIHTISTDVQTTVTHDVNTALNQASQAPVAATDLAQPSMHVFDQSEREARLAELKAQVSVKQEKLSQDVQATLSSSGLDNSRVAELGPVLKSSLSDIELLINHDTGAHVDLSPTARNIVSDVAEQAQQFQSVRQAFIERDGLDLYTDTDRDGISDYDEVHVYHTDPRNAYSGGGSLTDGEKVLLGFDVSTSTLKRIPVESPVASGEETKDMFEVYSIAVNKRPISEQATTSASGSVQTIPAQATVSSTTSPEVAGKLPVLKDTVTFAGRALPNSFVTLYIFSTPIVVTVKTDVSGAWTYSLDSELPDGDHKLYVATVDAGGKILAKSPAVPFVKTAEAADFTPLLISETPDADPLVVLRNNLVIVVGALIAIFGVAALMMLGAWKARPPEGPAAA